MMPVIVLSTAEALMSNSLPGMHDLLMAETSTVWKLASVALCIKSKNIAKNASIWEKRVPIERYDIQQYFDTRFH